MKLRKLLVLAVIALAISVIGIFKLTKTVVADSVTYVSNGTYPEKHLILNKDGSYGGSANTSLYGEGAPLNGALDHPDAGYYFIHDVYNATSTSYRTMIHNYRGYQQTMANTDGLACTLTALNYFGLDTDRLYSEQRLLQRYQDATGEKLTDDVTATGLQLMLSKMGIFSTANCFSGNYSRDYSGITKFVKDCLANNQIILMAFWGDNAYKWYTVIGVDEQNDTVVNNNVLILADPFDAADHYQDGYRELYIHAMAKYWLDMDRDVYIPAGASSETYTYACECLVIDCPKGVTLDTHVGEETYAMNDQTTIPQINLLPHYDQVTKEYYYGGKLQDDSNNTPWGGSDWKIYDKNRSDDTRSTFDTRYNVFTDWYEKDDSGTLLMLHHYAAKKQATASTCGICSLLSALVYLGVPYDQTNRNYNDYTCVNEWKIMRQVEVLNSVTVYNRGSASYELAKVAKKYAGINVLHSAGYNMTNYLKGTASMVYPTLQSMATQLKSDLSDDNPFLIGWNSTGGHWQVVIGYDDMGTPELYDDFCILADSSDGFDSLLDGYNVWSLYQVYSRWYNGSFHWNQQGLAVSND